jgi:hypothetical protein
MLQTKPISLRDYLENINNQLPVEKQIKIDDIDDTDSSSKLVSRISTTFSPEDYTTGKPQQIWEGVGFYYRSFNRMHDALNLYLAEYQQISYAQEELDIRIHKGSPLCWISDVYKMIGCPVHSRRYIFLTLCEDVIDGSGNVDPKTTGVYSRLLFQFGISKELIDQFINRLWKFAGENERLNRYPEWLLQNLGDNQWLIEFPSLNEVNNYVINKYYAQHLLSQSENDKSGKYLEFLAQYFLSCIPGLRTDIRKKTHSTDYDVICSLEGIFPDFRSELSRYFIVEAKNWKKRIDFSTIIKLIGVNEDISSNFGIIFSRSGITGSQKNKAAGREILKAFQRKKVIIIDLNIIDFKEIISGHNLINKIKGKYEIIRLDTIRNMK